MSSNLGECLIGKISLIITATKFPGAQLEDNITTLIMIGRISSLSGIVQNSSLASSHVKGTDRVGRKRAIRHRRDVYKVLQSYRIPNSGSLSNHAMITPVFTSIFLEHRRHYRVGANRIIVYLTTKSNGVFLSLRGIVNPVAGDAVERLFLKIIGKPILS